MLKRSRTGKGAFCLSPSEQGTDRTGKPENRQEQAKGGKAYRKTEQGQGITKGKADKKNGLKLPHIGVLILFFFLFYLAPFCPPVWSKYKPTKA